MTAAAAYAQPPWAGVELPAAPVGQLPPPIPGNPSTFTYSSPFGAYPWGFPAWAGGVVPTSYPGGGILATAVPARGLVTVTAWWPDAPQLLVVRVHPDGTRHPVRGGYPALAPATRHNVCPNPNVEVGLNGYIPGTGNPTFARVATTAGYALRATIAEDGDCGVTIPHALPAGVATVGLTLQWTGRPATVTLSVGWLDGGGGALAASTATLTADEINTSVDQFARHVMHLTPPSGAATTGTISITATDLVAGDAVLLEQVLIEAGSTDGSPFDGNDYAARWTGTTGLSESVLAPILVIDDGECPLDVAVTYIAADPRITGGQVTSSQVLLPSNAFAWLSHPSSPTNPLRVDVSQPPALEHAIDEGVFLPIGRRAPVVVTAAQRQAPTGKIDFYALGFPQRDLLRAMFANPAPLLLRAPSEYGYGTGMWLALGKIVEDRENRKAFHDAVLFSCEFTEVDAPPDQPPPAALAEALAASQPPATGTPVPQLAAEQEPLVAFGPVFWFAGPDRIMDHVLFGPDLAVLVIQDFATPTDVTFRAVNPMTSDTVWEHTVTFPEDMVLSGGECWSTATPETLGYAFLPDYPGDGLYTGTVDASGASTAFLTPWPEGAPDNTTPSFYAWHDGDTGVAVRYWTAFSSPFVCWRIPLSMTAAGDPLAVSEIHVNQGADVLGASIAYNQVQPSTSDPDILGLTVDPGNDHMLLVDDTGATVFAGPSFGSGVVSEGNYWVLQQVDRTQDLVALYTADLGGRTMLMAQFCTLSPAFAPGPLLSLGPISTSIEDSMEVRIASAYTDRPRMFNVRCRVMGRHGQRLDGQALGTIVVVAQGLHAPYAGQLFGRLISPGDGLTYNPVSVTLTPSTSDDGVHTLVAGTAYDDTTNTTHSIYQLFLT